MRRRQFILLLGGAAGWPLAARAQREQKRHIAVLMGGMTSGDPGGQAEAGAFEDGLRELGWKLGDNLELAYHWPGADLDAVRAAANQVMAVRPDLVVSRSTPATGAIMNDNLPTVFVMVTDPLGSHFVENLGQPGGNMTGFSTYESSVAGKWVELLKEAAPRVTRVVLLFNPQTAPFAKNYVQTGQAAALTLGATVSAAPCSGPGDIEAAFAGQAHDGTSGVIGVADTFISDHRDLIIDLAKRYRLPAIYGQRIFVPSGGLLAYAADYPDIFRHAASYVDRILKGEKPGNLPVQAPDKFTLSVNLKTAGAIGLSLPPTLVARADEVIE
jgi:putative tryptophan/tyrosine transport system substrate-binding protein